MSFFSRFTRIAAVSAALIAGALVVPAHAAGDDVSLLKTTLTPTGAERAGSADGKIPAWTGGYTTMLAGVNSGRRADPFANEKPVFSIAAADADKYAAQLTDGQKALLKKYPDYRMDVYATRRTSALPQSVYDAIAKNATSAKTVNGVLIGAHGGLPFPFPKNGEEVMWDHLTRYEGQNRHTIGENYTMSASGSQTFISRDDVVVQFPFYIKDTSQSDVFVEFRANSIAPPIKIGQQLVGTGHLDSDKNDGYAYLTGQRRVRKVPNACCDTPFPNADGALFFDEAPLFAGRLNDFEWKLLGKREMFIPYNDNKANIAAPKELLGPHFLNPNLVRWELHRVYVVDATVKPGHRHVMAHSIYYVDEDSLVALLADRWDARNTLSRSLIMLPSVIPDGPFTFGQAFGGYDFATGSYTMTNTDQSLRLQPPLSASYFSPESMAAESVR